MPDETTQISTQPFQTVSFHGQAPEITLTKAEIEERVVMESLNAGGLDKTIEAIMEPARKAHKELEAFRCSLRKLWALRVNQLFHDYPQLHAFRISTRRYDFHSHSYHFLPAIMIKDDKTLDDPPGWRKGYWNIRYDFDDMKPEEKKEFDESPRGQAYGAVYTMLEQFPEWFYIETFGFTTCITITAEWSIGHIKDPHNDIDREDEYVRKYYGLNDAMIKDTDEEEEEDDEDEEEENS